MLRIKHIERDVDRKKLLK